MFPTSEVLSLLTVCRHSGGVMALSRTPKWIHIFILIRSYKTGITWFLGVEWDGGGKKKLLSDKRRSTTVGFGLSRVV